VLAPGGRFVAYQVRAHVADYATPYLGSAAQGVGTDQHPAGARFHLDPRRLSRTRPRPATSTAACRARYSMPISHWMTCLAMKPRMPKASTKNRMKVPKRPAFESRASFQMMNSMNAMKAPTPQVMPNSAT
jgi:hypothetical protein